MEAEEFKKKVLLIMEKWHFVIKKIEFNLSIRPLIPPSSSFDDICTGLDKILIEYKKSDSGVVKNIN